MLPVCMDYSVQMKCFRVAEQRSDDMKWDRSYKSVQNVTTPQSNEADVPIYDMPFYYSVNSYSAQATTMSPLDGFSEEDTVKYEYQEPEENFVSIDDANIKGFLLKVGHEIVNAKKIASGLKNSAEHSLIHPLENAKGNFTLRASEIINPNNNEEKQEIVQHSAIVPHSETNRQTEDDHKERPGKLVQTEKERIIAMIELSDSSESELEDIPAFRKGDKSNYNNSANASYTKEDLSLANEAVTSDLNCNYNEDALNKYNHKCNKEQALVYEGERIDYAKADKIRCSESKANKSQNQPHECLLCGKIVQSSYNLRRHMMIHTGERPFLCDLCVRRFREFSDLKKHRRRHIHEPNFFCMICRVNKPTENDSTRCTICRAKNDISLLAQQPKKRVSIKSASSISSSVHLKPPPSPPTSENTLGQSFKLVTSDSPPPLAPITNSCGGSISVEAEQMIDNIPVVQQTDFNQVGMSTRKEYLCPLCQRPFGTRHNLKRHFMIHTGEKPFDCLKCRKPFREYSTLKKHMVTHQRDRWYKCVRCPVKYRDYLEYMSHKKEHPKEEESSSENITQYKNETSQSDTKTDYDSNDNDISAPTDSMECSECGQLFTDIELYTEHFKEHDPYSLFYECYICKKSFKVYNELLNHMNLSHIEDASNSQLTTNKNDDAQLWDTLNPYKIDFKKEEENA